MEGMREGAIWVRTSTEEQHAAKYLGVLTRWAADRGVHVDPRHVFVVEDSASELGKANGKGDIFDAKRAELLEGARMGRFNTVIIWSLDRLSRLGYDDLKAVLDKLRSYDAELWSHQEPWLSTIGPFGEIVIHMLAWMAQQQMAEHSAKIRHGMAVAKAEGKTVGGGKPGRKDKRAVSRTRRSDAVRASWTPERRAALIARNQARGKAS